ncbi:AMIN-like domain-containing (lipo)protein [Streptosporangium sp. KLBMP 9127]|nr:hypothetical protein [Streptosporangium sp. KLBMP 9127]
MTGTRIIIALVLLPLLAACGGGGDTARPVPDAPAAIPATTSATSPVRSPAALGPPTGTEEVEVTHATSAQPLVKRARFAGHAGYDRVVIDIDGEVPGYTVRWVDELVHDGSGEPIAVKGGAYLQVFLTPANAHTEDGSATWTGGPIFSADLANVRKVVKTGDFEGVVSVGIVLDHRAGFRVLEQKSPSRLVIDVAH